LLIPAASAKQAGEPIFCIEDSGKPFFQGMNTIFKSALTDPSLFHALSLVLSLAANNNLPNVEVLTHRGELLNGIRVNIKGLKGAPQVSTLTAMLLLISYEYRIDGSNSEGIAAHIQGMQTMMKLCKARNVTLIDEVQRALFWQDLLSCLMAGTPRFLSHRDFQDFRIPKDVDRTNQWELPRGFRSSFAQWPQEFALVLSDLNSLCYLVDQQCDSNKAPIDVFAIDNDQANLESRLIDLLSEGRRSLQDLDPWYEASILVSYICTYKLSTGIWMVCTNLEMHNETLISDQGCFIPEICTLQMLGLITKLLLDSQTAPQANLLSWLLFVSGGMTDRKEIRTQVSQLIHEVLPEAFAGGTQSWEILRNTLKNFVWCEYSMEHRIYEFWKEVYHVSKHEEEPVDRLTLPWSESYTGRTDSGMAANQKVEGRKGV
jgi:hypothetical protein